MSLLFHDFAYAARSLRRQPGFVVAAVGTLALAICANVTVFSMLNAVLLRPMPFGERTDRVMSLHSTHRLQAEDWDNSGVSPADLLDVRRESRAFEQVGGFIIRNFTVTSESDAERLMGLSITPDVFPLLGIAPALGRNFTPDEAADQGLESVVILTHGVWQRHYGGDPNIIGRAVTINDRARTVVGVMPQGFRFPHLAQLYMPLRLDERRRAARGIAGLALLKPGVTREQAQADADRIAARLEAAHPVSNRGFGLRVLTFRDSQIAPQARAAMGGLMVAVLFVLLIACANLANLLFVRGAARQLDLAVRAAMGASRRRLIGHVLAESAVITVAGTAIGLVGALWWLRAIPATWPEEFPYWIRFGMDARVVAFTAGLTVLTTFAVGLLPALRVSRPRVADRLTAAGRGATPTRSSHHLQQALAVAQVALSLALVVGAQLMIRSFLSIQRADIGFDHRPLLSMRVFLSGDAYDPADARAAFFDRVLTALEDVPTVVAAAATTTVPGDDGGSPVRVTAEGAAETDFVGAHAVTITRSLLDTLDVRPLSGRVFTAAESADEDADVVMINETLARRLWPGGTAVDRRIGFAVADGDGVAWRRVVGVTPDLIYEELGEQTEQSRMTVYLPYARSAPRTMALMVRGTGDPAALIAPVRAALRQVNPGLAVYDVLTMTERRRATSIDRRVFSTLMGGFATVALLLACLGIYALLADTARQRTQEIGVRLALGATPAGVVSMFLRQGAIIGGAGLAIGGVLAVMIAKGVSAILFGVDALAVGPMLVTAAALLAVVLLAAYVPARRASRVDPLIALRIN